MPAGWLVLRAALCLLSLSESPNLRSNLQSASVQAAVMVDAGVGVRVLALILDDLAADAAFAVHRFVL